MSEVGLLSLSEPPDALVDIIFVHGLRGDRLGTWEQNGRVWPRDFLSKELPRARILTYGYDADMIRFFDKTSQSNIAAHGRMLLANIMTRRRNPSIRDRPIIFIAHSLGGIVVKQALVNSIDAKSSGMNTRTAEIVTCTKGILFLATPHQGSAAAKWDSVARSLAGMLQEDHNDRLVTALRTGSETLENLRSSFKRWINRFLIVTVLEELEFGTIGKVVNDDSAILNSANEEVISIHANHLEMCRFASEDDNGYQLISDNIFTICESINPQIAAGDEPRVPAPVASREMHEASDKEAPRTAINDAEKYEARASADQEEDSGEGAQVPTEGEEATEEASIEEEDADQEITPGITPSPISRDSYAALLEAYADRFKSPTDTFTRAHYRLRVFRSQKTGDAVPADELSELPVPPGYKQLMKGFNEDSYQSQIRALYIASILGRESILDKLLSAGVNPNATPDFDFDTVHVTPLAVAIAFEEDEAVKLLLESEDNKSNLSLYNYYTIVDGQIVDIADDGEQTADQTAEAGTQEPGETDASEAQSEEPAAAPESDNGTAAEGEVEPENVESEVDSDLDETIAQEALSFTAMFGTSTAMTMVLERRGINQVPPSRQMLHQTVRYGYSSTLEVLIQWGARVDEPDEDGTTPLSYACLSGLINETNVLLEHGADPNIADQGQRNALHYAVGYACNNPGSNEVVERLLQVTEPPLDLNAQDEDGDPAIQYAILKPECCPLVDMLLDAGVSLKTVNKEGKTLLEQAKSIEGNDEIVGTIAARRITRSWQKHKFSLGKKMSSMKIF